MAGDVERNPGPRVDPGVGILYANIRGLFANLNELTVASAEFDVLVCSETLVSNRRHLSELRIPGFLGPQQKLRGSIPDALGLAVYVREGCKVFRQSKFECNCHESVVVRVCGNVHNFYVFGFYRNPHHNDSIYDCLLLAMAKVQEMDRKAAFVFVGDANAHHTEWLRSVTPTDGHGKAALDFCNLSGCTQLVVGSTHNHGNCLDLVMTEVPDVVKVAVGTPLGGSDHSFVGVKLLVNQVVHEHVVRRTVLLKGRANWDRIRSDMSALPWSDIIRSVDPVETLDGAVGDIISRRVTKVTLTIRSKDDPWFDHDCRRAFDTKQTAYRAWCRGRRQDLWTSYTRARTAAQVVYENAKNRYYGAARDSLMTKTNPHGWWSTLKSSLFGSKPSLPALCGPGGGLVVSPVEKAELLSSHFDSKQCRDPFVVPSACFPAPECCSLAFRSSVTRHFLLELDSYGGEDPLGGFPLFYKMTADILAPKLGRIFRRLIAGGSFPRCWRKANITAIPKGAPSPDVAEYRPISITPVLSKVFERLVSGKISRFLETSGLLPAAQFAYRKGLGCCDALLTVSHLLQKSLDAGCESRVVQLDFSAAFDRVNHAGLIYKLQCVGVGGVLLDVCREFLSERSQKVVVDGASSRQVDVVSGVPQGSVLGPLFFILYTKDLFDLTENHFFGYADDSTLVAEIRSPADRPLVAESLNRDLIRIGQWCIDWL